ncbi:hypothetical protein [Pedobacter caeni]|uniref:Uncharacterized protein n=1 Tax=Pedobacter caeni TaxID=288992 RepID=A0A1M4Z9C0_9SPHI|nr:hypothetical protein [Pedobacter caeni]SHF14621.1 hypothetical protein SAMN04488522_102240 [Pedobacter caeni]
MSVKLKPLTTLPFLLSLMLLLLNDFYFKAAFHNAFTGKLSDFCGLFIFPIFWAVLFPGKKNFIYFFTAVFFIYWKSSYSTPFIELFSRYVFPVQRTIDLTDLFALIVLPLSWYFQSIPQKRTFFNPYLAGLLTFFSFCATSQQRHHLHFEQPQYVLFQATTPLTDSNLVNRGFKVYNFPNLLAVQVEESLLVGEEVKYDDYHKNQILKGLDQEVLYELSDQYKVLPSTQINQLTIKTNDYQDYLIFRGSRLHGKFLRKNQDQILIEGKFKNGIEDSVWIFNHPNENTSTKKTFDKGETIRIEEFTASKLSSSKSVSTREETSMFKGFQLAFLFAIFVAIILLLRKNHRKSLPDPQDMKIGYKILLCIALPFFSWFLQFVIWSIIPDHYSASFVQIFILISMYFIGTPVFLVLLFWLKPRKQTDILWYCLLLSLLFVFWQETIVLGQLLEK